MAAGLSGRSLEQWPLMAKSRAGSYVGKAASARMIRQQCQVGREAKQNLLPSPLPRAIYSGDHTCLLGRLSIFLSIISSTVLF